MLAFLELIGKSAPALKQIDTTSNAWLKMSTAEKMNIAFESVSSDAKDDSKKNYAVYRPTGNRVQSPKNTEAALGILARLCVHAELAQPGESFSGAMIPSLAGQSVGIEVQKNAYGQSRVVRTMKVEDVSEEL